MNSRSNCNGNGTAGTGTCTNPCPPRFIQCTSPDVDLHPAPCPAILVCGEGSNPRITDAVTPAAPIALAEVEIDTTCLCFANLKIEFSTLMDVLDTGTTPPIVLQLSRICNNGTRKILSTYTINYAKTGGSATASVTTPISFVFCQENVPSKDCTYSIDIISADPSTFIQFANTSISALAVGCQRLC